MKLDHAVSSSSTVASSTDSVRKYLSVSLTRCCYTVNEFIYDVSRIYLLTYLPVRRRDDVVVTTSYDDFVRTTYDDVYNWF